MPGTDGPNVTDRVEELIDQIAKDIAPRMLANTLGPDPFTGDALRQLFDEPSVVDQAVLDHPKYDAAVEALGNDQDLVRIAPKGGRGPSFAAGDTWHRLSAEILGPVAYRIGRRSAARSRHPTEP